MNCHNMCKLMIKNPTNHEFYMHMKCIYLIIEVEYMTAIIQCEFIHFSNPHYELEKVGHRNSRAIHTRSAFVGTASYNLYCVLHLLIKYTGQEHNYIDKRYTINHGQIPDRYYHHAMFTVKPVTFSSITHVNHSYRAVAACHMS